LSFSGLGPAKGATQETYLQKKENLHKSAKEDP